MIPKWMQKSDNYTPIKGGNAFIYKTIKSIGKVMSKLKIQSGHEKRHAIPAIIKLFIAIALIVFLSVAQNKIIVLAIGAAVLAYLCIWPAEDILSIFKTSFVAAFIALVIFLPAMIMKPEGATNNLLVVCKVFLSVSMISIFNHTTQWNHITKALKKLHIPGVFIFTLDMTVKYIILLGNLINDLLTSLSLRSIGKNNKKYTSIGGIMGNTFLISVNTSQEMYEAMQCRGFTDDYKGLNK